MLKFENSIFVWEKNINNPKLSYVYMHLLDREIKGLRLAMVEQTLPTICAQRLIITICANK